MLIKQEYSPFPNKAQLSIEVTTMSTNVAEQFEIDQRTLPCWQTPVQCLSTCYMTEPTKLNLPEPPPAEMRTHPNENMMVPHPNGTNDLQDPRLK